MKDTLEEIKEMLAEQLHTNTDSADADTAIVEDLGADSLDVVELLMTIESKYGIAIPDEDVPLLKTVGDVAEYIDSHSEN